MLSSLLSTIFRAPPAAAEERHALDNPNVDINNPAAIEQLFGVTPTRSGISVSEEAALRFGAVYACINVLAQTVGSLPLHVYERDGDSRTRADGHSLQGILHDEPNPTMTSAAWREALMTHAAGWGNHYSLIEQTRGGRILGLWPLMPWATTPRKLKSGEIVYDAMLADGTRETLPADEVLHVPAVSFNGIVGLSPIGQTREAIGMGIAAERFGANFFANDARPGLVIELPQMNREEGARVKTELQQKLGGDKRFSTLVLGPGMKADSFGMPLTDAQFIESRKFSRTEIAGIFRVPPHMIGDLERATFANIEHQDLAFAKHTIRPWLVKIEQEINRKCFSRDERGRYFVEFNLDGLLRGDFKSRMEGYKLGIEAGVWPVNEVRAMENRGPVAGGDRRVVPKNMNLIDAETGEIVPDPNAARAASSQPEPAVTEPQQLEEAAP